MHPYQLPQWIILGIGSKIKSHLLLTRGIYLLPFNCLHFCGQDVCQTCHMLTSRGETPTTLYFVWTTDTWTMHHHILLLNKAKISQCCHLMLGTSLGVYWSAVEPWYRVPAHTPDPVASAAKLWIMTFTPCLLYQIPTLNQTCLENKHLGNGVGFLVREGKHLYPLWIRILHHQDILILATPIWQCV